jgi:hypothetical protein
MNSTETMLIATVVIGFIGLVCSLIALSVLWWISGLWGVAVLKRLKRVYHLTVILYWLERLEEHGVREFQKAEIEDLERIKAALSAEP